MKLIDFLPGKEVQRRMAKKGAASCSLFGGTHYWSFITVKELLMAHPGATAPAPLKKPPARNATRRVLFGPILASAFIVASAGVQAVSQEGVTAYEKDNYLIVLKQFKLLASRGDAAAQSSLGFMYANGQGVPQDYREAAAWYRKAAEQGAADAQFSLGAIFANGQGVPQDYREAAAWYRKAAEQGHARAQYLLGAMHDIGQGVPQDYRLAAMWFRKAAEQEAANARKNLAETHGKTPDMLRVPIAPGHEPAKAEAAEAAKAKAEQNAVAKKAAADAAKADTEAARLAAELAAAAKVEAAAKARQAAEAVRAKAEQDAATARANAEAARLKANQEVAQKTMAMNDNSQNAPPNYSTDEVATRYRKAAEQGIADAQFALGMMYAHGQGVQRDYKEAVAWYRRAAEQGYAKAQYNLGRMYINGQGVPYDYLQAVKWFNKATEQDSMEAHSQKGMLKRTASFR